MKQVPYQIAIVGQSGRGKTMGFRNMDPETTGYINAEAKPLPFIKDFKHYTIPNNWQETYQTLIEFAKNPDITTVVLDSFSAYVDSLLMTSRNTYKNHDIWNFYNDEISKLMYIIKYYPKNLIMTAHVANFETNGGITEQRIAVKGNEHNKAGIEHNFTITLFADVRLEDNKRNYVYEFQSNGVTTAKTPPFIAQGEERMDNDANAFLERINKVLNK